jgi:hypothetical protein
MSRSISVATEEQTTNAKQVSTAVENVNEVTQSAASAAEQMSSATEQLASCRGTAEPDDTLKIARRRTAVHGLRVMAAPL